MVAKSRRNTIKGLEDLLGDNPGSPEAIHVLLKNTLGNVLNSNNKEAGKAAVAIYQKYRDFICAPLNNPTKFNAWVEKLSPENRKLIEEFSTAYQKLLAAKKDQGKSYLSALNQFATPNTILKDKGEAALFSWFLENADAAQFVYDNFEKIEALAKQYRDMVFYGQPIASTPSLTTDEKITIENIEDLIDCLIITDSKGIDTDMENTSQDIKQEDRIVGTKEHVEEGGRAYLFMKEAKGQNLLTYLEENKNLSAEEKKIIIQGIIKAVIEFREKNSELFHLDIATRNFKYNPDTKEVSLVDFGTTLKVGEDAILPMVKLPSELQNETLWPMNNKGRSTLMSTEIGEKLMVFMLGTTIAEVLGIKVPLVILDPLDLSSVEDAQLKSALEEMVMLNHAERATLSDVGELFKLTSTVTEIYENIAYGKIEGQSFREKYGNQYNRYTNVDAEVDINFDGDYPYKATTVDDGYGLNFLAEGPYQHSAEHAAQFLKSLIINDNAQVTDIIVAGDPHDGRRDGKGFLDYFRPDSGDNLDSLKKYGVEIISRKEISEGNSDNIQDYRIKIRFGEIGKDIIIHHVKNFKDFGTATFTDKDVEKLLDIRLNAKRVATHCSAGLGRTGVISMAYIASANPTVFYPNGHAKADAFKDKLSELRKRRPGLIQKVNGDPAGQFKMAMNLGQRLHLAHQKRLAKTTIRTYLDDCLKKGQDFTPDEKALIKKGMENFYQLAKEGKFEDAASAWNGLFNNILIEVARGRLVIEEVLKKEKQIAGGDEMLPFYLYCLAMNSPHENAMLDVYACVEAFMSDTGMWGYTAATIQSAFTLAFQQNLISENVNFEKFDGRFERIKEDRKAVLHLRAEFIQHYQKQPIHNYWKSQAAIYHPFLDGDRKGPNLGGYTKEREEIFKLFKNDPKTTLDMMFNLNPGRNPFAVEKGVFGVTQALTRNNISKIKNITIEQIVEYILGMPKENAENAAQIFHYFFAKRGANLGRLMEKIGRRNFRKEIGERPDLLETLLLAADNSPALRKAIDQSQLMMTSHFKPQVTADLVQAFDTHSQEVELPLIDTSISQKPRLVLERDLAVGMQKLEKLIAEMDKNVGFSERLKNYITGNNVYEKLLGLERIDWYCANAKGYLIDQAEVRCHLEGNATDYFRAKVSGTEIGQVLSAFKSLKLGELVDYAIKNPANAFEILKRCEANLQQRPDLVKKLIAEGNQKVLDAVETNGLVDGFEKEFDAARQRSLKVAKPLPNSREEDIWATQKLDRLIAESEGLVRKTSGQPTKQILEIYIKEINNDALKNFLLGRVAKITEFEPAPNQEAIQSFVKAINDALTMGMKELDYGKIIQKHFSKNEIFARFAMSHEDGVFKNSATIYSNKVMPVATTPLTSTNESNAPPLKPTLNK